MKAATTPVWLLYAPIVLELLVLLLSLTSAAPLRKVIVSEADKSVWLADAIFYDDVNIYDLPQGDQAAEQQPELCPPVPSVLPDGSCHAKKCTSDRECARGGANRKCCYNGCIYTCLPELTPPAFLDWIREPRRRLSSGLSWLITGPDHANEEEPCSTTPVEDDSDPLLCPTGYVCNIYDEGITEKGIPNQGVCIQATDEETTDDLLSTSEDEDDFDDVTQEIIHAHACDLEGMMLLEGHSMRIDGKRCMCESRELVCNGET